MFTTVQSMVLIFALLHLGETQRQQGRPLDEVLNESEGAELCSRAEVRELQERMQNHSQEVTQLLSLYLSAITTLQEKVDRVEGKVDRVEEKVDRVEEKVERVEGKVDRVEEKVDRVEGKVERVEGKVDRVEGKVERVEGKVDRVEGKVERVEGKVDRVEGKVDRVEEASNNHNREVSQMLTHLDRRLDTVVRVDGSYQRPAPSCKDIPAGSPSRTYWIQGARGATPVYCDMTRQCCDSRGGWMRVAHLDMTDPNQQCPPGFRMITSPKRMCGRPGLGGGCVSTTFPVHGVEYRKVCGKVIGYQYYSPEGFTTGIDSIDSYYVHGVSITHGQSPRKHIWTFAAALDEARTGHTVCSCTRPDLTYTGTFPIPSFIGQDYFCETGSRSARQHRYYPEDPLWDGRGCGSRSTCCSFNNPPWFCKELPQPTTEDIELRICANASPGNEDTPTELVELFVQ